MSNSDEARQTAKRLERRHRADRRFRRCGQGAIFLVYGFLALFFGEIALRGLPSFFHHSLSLPILLSPKILEAPVRQPIPPNLEERQARALLREALEQQLGRAPTRQTRRDMLALLPSLSSLDVLDALRAAPSLRVGETIHKDFPLASQVEFYLRDTERGESLLSSEQRAFLDTLQTAGLISNRFNASFFTRADSREPESAGILGAMLGSMWALLIAFLIAFPLGVGTAIYMQEFAAKTRWTQGIEVMIYNLAAVPSIVFGLLGLAVFLNWWNLPRSVPLVGGMVLALMTMPTIIVASRSALGAIPDTIRHAGLALGASRMQSVFHHVVPQAMPGILTGTIIGMAQALGETAPLLLIGMVAFIAHAPLSPIEPSSALPVQIFLWADHPDPAFSEKAAGAIIVMLLFLVAMNTAAVALRRRFERKTKRGLR